MKWTIHNISWAYTSYNQQLISVLSRYHNIVVQHKRSHPFAIKKLDNSYVISIVIL